MWYELTKEKGRCHAKRVLYLLGVRNVVTTIEREVVLSSRSSGRIGTISNSLI